MGAAEAVHVTRPASLSAWRVAYAISARNGLLVKTCQNNLPRRMQSSCSAHLCFSSAAACSSALCGTWPCRQQEDGDLCF